eukprot:5750367-Prorocentrum_lima.AAC.1
MRKCGGSGKSRHNRVRKKNGTQAEEVRHPTCAQWSRGLFPASPRAGGSGGGQPPDGSGWGSAAPADHS